MRDFQRPYARDAAELASWSVADAGRVTLREVVEGVRPTILIGTSAQPGAFDEGIVRGHSDHCVDADGQGEPDHRHHRVGHDRAHQRRRHEKHDEEPSRAAPRPRRIEKGERDAAIADYTAAVAADPRTATAYANRGVLRLQKGQEKLAEADFAQAVQLDPSLKPALEKYRREMKEHNAKARQK